MTLSSDQNSNPTKLSATSRKMLALRTEVFAQWKNRVRNCVEQAGTLRHPVLIDTLPSFYDNMAQSLTPGYPRKNAVSTTTVATEHGGQRARLTNYELKSVVQEYQLLRAALLETLQRQHVRLRERELQLIDESIDSAIREAVTAYALAQAALREKFMAALMHDLTNPLSAADMNAVLIARTADSPRVRALADKIIEHHRRLGDMLHDLLDTLVFQGSARLPLQLASFDILALVREVAQQAQALHGPRFALKGEAISVVWSREEVRRALENLIGNAVKYGAADTPISIAIEHVDERVLVSVHNQGEPIPAQDIEDIFQIFQRAQAARQGAQEGWGIGLPFVRAVAESHGGNSIVDSSHERGTTFWIDMPLDARPFQDAPTLG